MKKPYKALIPICAAASLFIGLSMSGKLNKTALPVQNQLAPRSAKSSQSDHQNSPVPSAPNRGMTAKPTLPSTPMEDSPAPRSGDSSADSADRDAKEPKVISDYQAWTAMAGKIITVNSDTYALRDGFAIAHKSGEWITGDSADLRFDKAHASVEVDIPGQAQIDRGMVTMEGDGVNILEQNLDNGDFVRTTLFSREVVVNSAQGKQVWPAGTMITEDQEGRILMIESNATSRALVDELFGSPHD